MKKVIITGGAGYIGSHTVVQLVAAGYEPIIVDNLSNSQASALKGIGRIMGRDPEFHQVDCRDEAAMNEVFDSVGEVHGVIHFAAFKSVSDSIDDPLAYYQNNVGSTAALLRVMEQKGVNRMVFSSSCTVYGVPDELPVTERSKAGQAASPYGYSKVICEQMLQDVHQAKPDIDVVLLRYFNPVGAHPSGNIGELPLGIPSNLVPFITQTAAGLRKELVIHGDDYGTPDGTCIRDFIHVMDLADAHVRALGWMEEKGAPRCEAFNLGTGQGESVKNTVNTFVKTSGVELPHSYGPRRAGDIEQIWADTTKSREVLGWRTTRSFEEALRDAWNWQLALKKMGA